MTRVAVYGSADLAEAARVLGLLRVVADPELVLVDLREPEAVIAASAIATDVPRVLVVGDAQDTLLRAIGVRDVARSTEPAAIGPLVLTHVPRRVRSATRLVLATGVRGGVGRTLLVANLAMRLARRVAVCAIDATGSGALAWWLRADARPWSEIEGLASELAPEHIRIVASSPRERLRVLGGAPTAPSVGILRATVGAALALGDLVLVDAPSRADERTRALSADRRIVLAYDDATSLAAIGADPLEDDDWLIASQSSARALGGLSTFRALPRDERSVAQALAERGPMGGALGRAYDELAALLAIDAT